MAIKFNNGLIVAVCAVMLMAATAGAYASVPGLQRSDPPETNASSQQEMIEAMLHSVAVYVLAVEMLAYLEDGPGGAETLTQKYSTNPGWIPAFGKAEYDGENHILYVPLGQCVWKIQMGVRGEPRFGLLQPTDKDLDENDKGVLAMHLFRLMNDADLHQDAMAAAHNALAAESLLFPVGRRDARPPGKSIHPASRKSDDLLNNL